MVSAKETPSSTAVTREITYNVVSGAPIIEEVGTQTIYSNFENDIFIEIQNRPTSIQVEGLLLGVKYEPDQEDAEDEDDDPLEGVRITGTFPNAANLTIDSTNFIVTASSDGGEDTYSVPITLPRDLKSIYRKPGQILIYYKLQTMEHCLTQYRL